MQQLPALDRPYLVVSSVGTSVLTNGADPDVRPLITVYANARDPEQAPPAERAPLHAWLQEAAAQLRQATDSQAAERSAELNALLALNRERSPHPRDLHVLLCTDTWLGEHRATMVADWLRARGQVANVHRVRDLRTDEPAAFAQGIGDAIQWCEETIPEYHEAGYHVVFNLNGGFKGVQGVLQTLGMFHADEIVYQFERSSALLRIPRLPITLTIEDTLREHLVDVRRLALGLAVERVVLPESLTMRIGDDVALSPWGDLVWKKARRTLYRERLFPPPSPRIRYGAGFEQRVRGLQPDLLAAVNERVDDLARHLESPAGANVRRLDLKPIKAERPPPSTHELDAWAGRDARRIFGHYEGQVFVLDRLGAALH